MSEKWTPFYFNGNLWFGPVTEADDWPGVLGSYCDDMDILKGAKRNPHSEFPDFGTYAEYDDGTETLEQWAKKHGMDLFGGMDQKGKVQP